MLLDPIRVTLLVTQVFEKLGVRYLIGGSLASTIYGRIRTTQDADIVTDMQLSQVQPFVKALQSEFFIDEHMLVDAVQHNSSFNIIHRSSFFKVDVFIPEESPFRQVQFKRAQSQVVIHDPDVSANFASPEDTVLSKLVWFRLGGDISSRQWEDVIGVLQLRRDELDLEYLRQWAGILRILDLLEKALQECQPE
jgi:hypothetical protein